MSTLEVIKRIRLRTGFFKIYESVDRLDMLEKENEVLKNNIRDVKQEASIYKSKIDEFDDSNKTLA